MSEHLSATWDLSWGGLDSYFPSSYLVTYFLMCWAPLASAADKQTLAAIMPIIPISGKSLGLASIIVNSTEVPITSTSSYNGREAIRLIGSAPIYDSESTQNFPVSSGY